MHGMSKRKARAGCDVTMPSWQWGLQGPGVYLPLPTLGQHLPPHCGGQPSHLFTASPPGVGIQLLLACSPAPTASMPTSLQPASQPVSLPVSQPVGARPASLQEAGWRRLLYDLGL